MTILIGADPEMFLFSPEEKKFVSAHNLLPGTKEAPVPFDDGSAVQVDGVAAEFNIQPADRARDFSANCSAALANIHSMLGGKYILVPTPHIEFSAKDWAEIPPEAKALGCTPDYNAWRNGRRNPTPDNTTRMRTGAGHVHIGITDYMEQVGIKPFSSEHTNLCCSIVKELDRTLGIDSIEWDKDSKRSRLYGKAGAYRPKHYGLEYRVLSNAWLTNAVLMNFVFSRTFEVVSAVLRGDTVFKTHSLTDAQVCEAISTRVIPEVKKEGQDV